MTNTQTTTETGQERRTWPGRIWRRTEAPADSSARPTVTGRGTVVEAPPERKAAGRAEPAALPRRARSSGVAVVGMIVGLTGLYAALTGVLSRPAIAVGFLGVLISAAGLQAARKRHVSGRGIALLGLLFGLGAIALGAAMIGGWLDWLNDRNQVSWVHAWLDEHVPWLV